MTGDDELVWGDAVALASVTSFLLVNMVPWMRRYTGMEESDETVEFETWLHECREVRQSMESAAFGASILAGQRQVPEAEFSTGWPSYAVACENAGFGLGSIK